MWQYTRYDLGKEVLLVALLVFSRPCRSVLLTSFAHDPDSYFVTGGDAKFF